MSAAATAAGYLYASGRLNSLRGRKRERAELEQMHGPAVAKALTERRVTVTYRRSRAPK